MSALLALSASLLWGGSDFMGGTASRRLSPFAVIAWADSLVLVVLLVLAAALGQLHPDLGVVLWGSGAGVAGLVGVIAFYRALADGTMGIVSPVTGLGVVVPVLVGVALGDRPDGAQVAGMVVGLVAVVLVSGGRGTGRMDPRILGLAVVAGAGFGLAFVFIDEAEPHGTLMTLLMMRLATLVAIAAGCLVARRTLPVRPRDLTMLGLIGASDVLANASFAAATTRGELAVVSVLSSLYPAVTAVLARVVHDERMNRRQLTGVGASLVAIVLLAAGPSA
jgi:drug/metabolite transporter (DMT)-like permease